MEASNPDKQPPTPAPEPNVDRDRKPFMTGQDLLDSGIIGMWADRDDITDSVEFAHELRERNQRRRLFG